MRPTQTNGLLPKTLPTNSSFEANPIINATPMIGMSVWKLGCGVLRVEKQNTVCDQNTDQSSEGILTQSLSFEGL